MARPVWLLLLTCLPCGASASGLSALFLASTSSLNVVTCQLVESQPIHRVFVSESAQSERILDSVQPAYPSAAKTKGIQGDVVLRVIVAKDGVVEEIHLVRGAPALVDPAVKAVWQWRYEPYLLNGKPVEVETRVTIHFRLPPQATRGRPSWTQFPFRRMT